MWRETIKNPKFQLLGVGLSSGVLGLLAGVFLAQKKAEKKYKEISDTEIDSVKDSYARLHKTGKYGLEEMASKYGGSTAPVQEIITEEGYGVVNEVPATPDDIAAELERRKVQEEIDESVSDEPEELAVVTRNIFESNDPDTFFNWEEEMERREAKPLDPYVITKEEFYQGEKDYEQVNLTWFDGDDVLVDSRDSPVDNTDSTVGDSNLLRFGHGSEDKNVVYIRNERLEIDIEIAKSNGKFAEEVLGFIEHSDHRRPRKFRHDD